MDCNDDVEMYSMPATPRMRGTSCLKSGKCCKPMIENNPKITKVVAFRMFHEFFVQFSNVRKRLIRRPVCGFLKKMNTCLLNFLDVFPKVQRFPEFHDRVTIQLANHYREPFQFCKQILIQMKGKEHKVIVHLPFRKICRFQSFDIPQKNRSKNAQRFLS